MATTTLQPTALPGKPYSFSAKTAASGAHTGNFTELSVTATPGARHSFSAKDAASSGHTGDFTRLSVLGVPGGIHSFIAKQEAITATQPAGAGKPKYKRDYLKEQLIREDTEILEIIAIAINKGLI